jgi:hypothetical protein
MGNLLMDVLIIGINEANQMQSKVIRRKLCTALNPLGPGCDLKAEHEK